MWCQSVISRLLATHRTPTTTPAASAETAHVRAVQAFSTPAQRADSGVAASGGLRDSQQASRSSVRLDLGARPYDVAAAGAGPMASEAPQDVSVRRKRPAAAADAAVLAPPGAVTMHRTGSCGGGGPAVPGENLAGLAVSAAADGRGHLTAATAEAAADTNTSRKAAEANKRIVVHFRTNVAGSSNESRGGNGSSPVASSASGRGSGDGLEAPEAPGGAPGVATEGPEASGVSASSVGSLPEFPAFPVAGCADMASRIQRLDPAEPPSNDVHTTAVGEHPQRHDTMSFEQLLCISDFSIL